MPYDAKLNFASTTPKCCGTGVLLREKGHLCFPHPVFQKIVLKTSYMLKEVETASLVHVYL